MKKLNLLAAAAIAAAGAPALAASFDCGKAVSRVEKLICADRTVSQQDEILAEAYKDAQAKARDRASLKRWQKAWLERRDNCADAACLKKLYAEQNNDLRGFARAAGGTHPVSGAYVRYFKGKPDKHEASLDVFELDAGRVRLLGSAIWVGNAAIGNVNLGEIDGVARLDGRSAAYKEEGEQACRLNLHFDGDTLRISDDNMQCGGHNVSFDGEYRRVIGK
ncbi:lysozyme inhibitor LprI family protein [Massilia sp. erpn]|uniref:lysozyme inhibitor LprI family protein n=1 Tax=Massilia sp. erpn TaxID=2738142 RepID=UPI0021049BF1|nr:lysozyme inhibitor LprI family protein [Massilia sp. erpn]UTY59593.1 hypothetical protein HPQ68_21895 [Massilia sp. erpn]